MSFASELKALLQKYNATISFECGEGSDTHGIFDERIVCWGEGDRVLLQTEYGSYGLHVSDIEVN